MNRTHLSALTCTAALLLAASAHANDLGNEGPDLGNKETAPPPPASCAGDYDGNGQVNFADILAVINDWGQPDTGSEDGARIGFHQLLSAVSHMGEACG